MKRQGIYAIEHEPSGCRYIGSSVHIASRWVQHVSALSANKHFCRALQASWNEHGPDEFALHILEDVADRSLLTVKEQKWIDRTPERFNGRARVHTPYEINLDKLEAIRKVTV